MAALRLMLLALATALQCWRGRATPLGDPPGAAGTAFATDVEVARAAPDVVPGPAAVRVGVVYDRVGGWRTYTAHTAVAPVSRLEALAPIDGCGYGPDAANVTLTVPEVTADAKVHRDGWPSPSPRTKGAFPPACEVVTNAGFYTPEEGSAHRCLGSLVEHFQWQARSDRRLATFAVRQGRLTADDADAGSSGGSGSAVVEDIVVGYLNRTALDNPGTVPVAPIRGTHSLPRPPLTHARWRTLVSGLGWLVRNGRSNVEAAMKAEAFDVQTTGDKYRFRTISAPRLAIGHDALGRVVLVAVDGEEYMQSGVSLDNLAQILVNLGFVNAINLDGGGSVSFFANGTVANVPADDCYAKVAPKARKRCPRAVASALCLRSQTPPRRWQADATATATVTKTVSATASVSRSVASATTTDGDVGGTRNPLLRLSFHRVVLVAVAAVVLAAFLACSQLLCRRANASVRRVAIATEEA